MRIFKSEVKEMQSDGKRDDAAAGPVADADFLGAGRACSAPATEPSTEQRPA